MASEKSMLHISMAGNSAPLCGATDTGPMVPEDEAACVDCRRIAGNAAATASSEALEADSVSGAMAATGEPGEPADAATKAVPGPGAARIEVGPPTADIGPPAFDPEAVLVQPAQPLEREAEKVEVAEAPTVEDLFECDGARQLPIPDIWAPLLRSSEHRDMWNLRVRALRAEEISPEDAERVKTNFHARQHDTFRMIRDAIVECSLEAYSRRLYRGRTSEQIAADLTLATWATLARTTPGAPQEPSE